MLARLMPASGGGRCLTYQVFDAAAATLYLCGDVLQAAMPVLLIALSVQKYSNTWNQALKSAGGHVYW